MWDVAFEKLVSHVLNRLSDLMEGLSLEPRRLSSDDRVILEETILPYLGGIKNFQTVLFVGCAAYTQWYEKFFTGKNYWTIDRKKVKRKYGSRNHITDSIVNLERYFSKNYFDCIIMNGVIGYGLNNASDIERALDACFHTLDTQGILVIGWNDSKVRMPVDIGSIEPLKKFEEHHFAPLQTCHYRTGHAAGHTFSFYRKK